MCVVEPPLWGSVYYRNGESAWRICFSCVCALWQVFYPLFCLCVPCPVIHIPLIWFLASMRAIGVGFNYDIAVDHISQSFICTLLNNIMFCTTAMARMNAGDSVQVAYRKD